MTKRVIIGIGFLFTFFLGIWTANKYFNVTTPTVSEESTVLLEKIKTVTKLITVEGYFSEIYDYKDFYYYDFSPFRKKALLRVKAKVSVGYDFENMKMETRPDERILVLSQLPQAEILSVDHEVDYYDVQEGTFNGFTPEELTKLNKNAKEFIEQKALESSLMKTADAQLKSGLEVIKFMAEEAGWKLETKPATEKLNEKN